MTRLKSAHMAKAERQALMARSSSVGPFDGEPMNEFLRTVFPACFTFAGIE